MYDEETQSILRDPYERREYQPLTKAEEDHLIVRAVRGEAAALAEILGRYRGLIVNESRASYLRNTALAHEAESIAELAFIEALHDYDPKHGATICGLCQKPRPYGALWCVPPRAAPVGAGKSPGAG